MSRGVKIIDLGRGHNLEDIVEAGENVTSTYISGPPGHGNTPSVAALLAVLNHPWVLGIGTGLIVVALAWWFGWN